LAEVFYLGSVGITLLAEVFKLDVDFEIWRQNLSFVFPDIFRGQFHFACNDVVSILNESRVEHDSE
jgi:hypothetical protein